MATASFHDRALTPKPYVNSGSRSHFFQQPSISTASTPLQRSSYDGYYQGSGTQNAKKRTRNDSIHSERSTSYSVTPGAWSSITDSPDLTSPLPLANTRYRLAGGLDTPSAAIASGYEDAEGGLELAFRRGGGNSNRVFPADDYFGRVPSALDRERNGHSRAYTPNAQSDGWGQAVVAVVSGVVEKVWEFCKAGAFKGFRAGGTQGYKMSESSHPSYGVRSVQSSIWQDLSPSTSRVFDESFNHPSTSIPGCFPASDPIQDYNSSPGLNTTPLRPGKRPKYDSSSSWVLVPSHIPTSRSPSPSRLSSRKLPSTASTPAARRPASSAGLRRPVLPASRPSLGHHTHSTRPASSASTRSPLPSPKRPSHRSTKSHAECGRGEGFGPEEEESPVSAEAQRYAARVRKREQEEDRALSGFNARLKAMIKEGREALGTRIEVEMEEVEGD